MREPMKVSREQIRQTSQHFVRKKYQKEETAGHSTHGVNGWGGCASCRENLVLVTIPTVSGKGKLMKKKITFESGGYSDPPILRASRTIRKRPS